MNRRYFGEEHRKAIMGYARAVAHDLNMEEDGTGDDFLDALHDMLQDMDIDQAIHAADSMLAATEFDERRTAEEEFPDIEFVCEEEDD